MQQLVRLRRRPPFPDGFFTSCRTGSSSGNAYSNTGLHRFSDSSRSRPPSRNNGGGRGNSSGTSRNSSNGRGGKQAQTQQQQQQETTTPETIAGRVGAGLQPPPQQRPFMSNFTKEHPLQQIPSSIRPVSILRTSPIDICLDNFYSLQRPLLEVTTIRSERRSASSKDWKPLSIVGESKSEDLPRGDLDLMGNELVGEYDHYLVTEPEGADPSWGEGADRYLAALEHNVPPSVPSTSQASPPVQSSTRKITEEKKKSKGNESQQDIDYLFPWQAEERQKKEASKAFNESVQMSPAASRRPSHMQQMMERASQANRRVLESSDANRFLSSHLVKNTWSGLWDWETVRKALSSAQHKASKGKEKASLDDKSSLRKPLEALRQTSRSTLRFRARAKRSARERNQQFEAFREMLERSPQLGEKGKSGGRDGGRIMVVVEADLQGGTGGNRKRGKSGRSLQQDVEGQFGDVIQRAGEVSKFFDKNVAFEGALAASPFSSDEAQGEFITIDLDGGFAGLSEGQDASTDGAKALPERDSAGNVIPEEARRMVQQIMDAWNTGTKAGLTAKADREGRRDIREIIVGSRFSLIQCGRGRNLRPLLADRLSIRGVELVGEGVEKVQGEAGVSLDSVKRKRKKRISRHKYKKRRKATRAERRRTGK